MYEVFLAPVYWLYLALGAPVMDRLCSLPAFRGWGTSSACPSGIWYCVGGNILWALWLGAGACAASVAARCVRAAAPLFAHGDVPHLKMA